MGSMSMDSNFEELLSLFTRRGVRFLVVGGYAFASHATPRATKDLDLWVEATTENAARAWRALAEFGMPLGDIEPDDLATPGPWLVFGRAPVRVDVLTAVDGLEFADCWERHVVRPFGRVTAPVLSIDDLIRTKRLVGRKQDLADVENLARRRAQDSGEGRVSEAAPTPRRRRRPAAARRKRGKAAPRKR
jgi:hypothetical protein